MSRSKLFFAGLVAAMIALTAGVYMGMAGRDAQAPASLIPATAIAQLFAARMTDANGKTQAFDQWRGKTLVINFWATWCPPCLEEMPAFSRLQARYRANGVQFVGIALDTAENVINFSRKYPVDYPLLIGDAEATELARQLGNANLALPYTVVLGASGEVRMTRLGRLSEQELDKLLQKAVAP